jgi:hypothetical protein
VAVYWNSFLLLPAVAGEKLDIYLNAVAKYLFLIAFEGSQRTFHLSKAYTLKVYRG